MSIYLSLSGWDPFMALSRDDVAAVAELYGEQTAGTETRAKGRRKKEKKKKKWKYFPMGWDSRETNTNVWRNFYYTLYDSKWHNLLVQAAQDKIKNNYMEKFSFLQKFQYVWFLTKWNLSEIFLWVRHMYKDTTVHVFILRRDIS